MTRTIAMPVLVVLLISLPLAALPQTPPVRPNVQETPLPPPVEIKAPPSSVPADVPERPLTADEAAAIALRRGPAVAEARAGLSAAQGRRQQARAGLLPSLATGAGYTNTAISPSIPTGSTLATTSSSGYQATADVRQLVFDFNHTRDLVRQASARELAAAARLTRVESDLVLQVKQAFYSLLQGQRLAEVNEANVRNQRNHLASARARLDEGMGLPADVVRAETAIANAVFNLNLARNSASIARVNLAELMGIDPRTPIQPADSREAPVRSEASESADADDELDNLVVQALGMRPEMRQAHWDVEASRLGVNAAQTDNAPSVGTSAGWLQRGSTFPPDAKSLTYGVAMRWTPFDSGLTRGRVSEAQANLTASQAQMESIRLDIIGQVSRAYLNLQTAEQRITTADAEVANAEEALRLIEGRYRAGVGTFLDVLDAQTAVFTARTNRVNAQSASDQARVALAHAIGAIGVR